MPDDLLRHVIGPTPYSSLWLWLAIALSVLLVGWYAGVFLFTMPRRRLGTEPLVGASGPDDPVPRRADGACHR